MTGREIHDQIRQELPEGASCISDCPFCIKGPEVASHKEEKKVSEDKSCNQETVDALIASTRSMAAEEAKAESDKQIADLEATVAEKDTALEEAKAAIEKLEGEIKDAAELARLAELADERASQVAEVATFPDEYVSERKVAWASQSDDEFTKTLADFKSIAEAPGSKETGKTHSKNLNGTRETAGQSTGIDKLRGFLATGRGA